MNSDKKLGIGLKFALNGFRLGCTQRNFIILLVIAGLVVVAGFLFPLTTTEWCLVLFCIAGVLSLELLNSAIELIVDQISPDCSIFCQTCKRYGCRCRLYRRFGFGNHRIDYLYS